MSKPCQSVLFCKYLLFSLLIISKQRFVSKKSTLSPKFDIFYAQSISNLLRSCKNVSFLKTENEKKWLSANKNTANSNQHDIRQEQPLFLTLNAEYGVKDRRSHYVTLQRQQNFWMTTNRKRSLKTVSEFIDLVLFQLICQLLANLFGVKSERTEFEFRKRKKQQCVVFTQFIKRTREIRKFHVVVVLQRLRNIYKDNCH